MISEQWKSKASGGRRGSAAVADAPLQVMVDAKRLELMGDAFSVVRLHADHGDVAEEITALVPEETQDEKTQDWRAWDARRPG